MLKHEIAAIAEKEKPHALLLSPRLFYCYIHKVIKSHHIIFDTCSVLDQWISINTGLTW